MSKSLPAFDPELVEELADVAREYGPSTTTRFWIESTTNIPDLPARASEGAERPRARTPRREGGGDDRE